MFHHVSILPSSDIYIGYHVTLWCHNSTSVHHPRISSSTNAVKFKLTPEILLDKRCWLMCHYFGEVTNLYFTDRKSLLQTSTEIEKWCHQSTYSLVPQRSPPRWLIFQNFFNQDMLFLPLQLLNIVWNSI